MIDQAALGVTELLTNVHRHAEPDKMCTVEIELLLERLMVSVHDHDPRLPVVHDAEPFETSGRGLAMVAAVSESWGVRPHGDDGKVVWFTLCASPAAAPLPAYPGYGSVSADAFAETPSAVGAHAPARSAVAG